MNRKLRLLGAMLALTFSGLTYAEEGSTKFPVRAYAIEGNTLLTTAEIDNVLRPFTGAAVDFATIQLAISTLEAHYNAAGFGAVKVVLPEQDIEDGKVRLRIVEAKIGRIVVDGNKHFSAPNVRASLPGLREGEHPNMLRIDAQLRVANENAAKQTNLVLRRGAREGELDALVRVADQNPLRIALTADNTGAPAADGKYSTGKFRTGLIVQHSNLFDRDHALSMQYLTSPDHLSKVTIFGLGYRIPLYAYGDALEFAYGYSNVDSGTLTTAAGSYGISGSGKTFVAKYEQFLPKWGDWMQKLAYGLDYRIYTSSVKAAGSNESLVPDTTVHPLSLTYSGTAHLSGQDISLSLGVIQNIPGGANGTTEAFNRPGGRQGANASYQLWRYQLNGTQLLPADWMLRGTVQGQLTHDALVSGEQFGAGGVDSVRGFQERMVANDYGHRAGVELYAPDLGKLFNTSDLKARLLVFYDMARLHRNHALPGEVTAQQLSSHGVGLRAGYGKSLSLRLDFAVVDQGAGVTTSGSKMLHASVVGYF